MTRDDQIAALLEAGATYQEVQQQLHVRYGTARRVRDDRRIPTRPGRAKRTRAELDALEVTVIAMLLTGATAQEIYDTTRISPNHIVRLRRELKIPLPERDRGANTRLTLAQAYARHTVPADGGHVLWTGPRNGRGLLLIASGRNYNARHIAFRKHYGRDPDGSVRRRPTCDQPACIAGAHQTDRTIRQQFRRQQQR
ncbi:hypothetical protein ACFYQA_17405 [Streptomyces sp. NPDC005774]|uniref:hypothetical protein n=1 Tax=Streptomyces sp. NPDC005774 TaxID=3364728 RepID=UPI00367A8C1C